MDPRLLYTFDPRVWASLAGEQPVLLHFLDGYVDAAAVTHNTGAYILEQCDHEVLAEFDHDQLHDYRSRRPQMTFDTNQWVDLVEWSLRLYKATDASGRAFLVLLGPEPDTQWGRACAAVLGIAERLDVSMLVTATAVPMAVPHTRPTLVTAHATDEQLAQGNPVWIDRIQIPGSFSAMLEFRAGQAGITGLGFVAHVPHYLAQSTFGQATAAVLDRIREATGLDIPAESIRDTASANLASIEAEAQNDADFPGVVGSLEEQYDALQESGSSQVPSADEIGAAVEQFLAEQHDDGED